MYPKPKRKKQKSTHITNPRLDYDEICEICGKQAHCTHELKGGSMRNKSIQYGFQMKLCTTCHRNYHEKYTKEQKNHLRYKKQLEIMKERDWTLINWMAIFKESWLR
jgi:hypothetical protein